MRRSGREDVAAASKDAAAKLLKGKAEGLSNKDVKKLLEKAFVEGVKYVDKTAGANSKKLPEEYDRRKKMLSGDWETAERMYYEYGESYASISRHFNVSLGTVWLHFNPEKKKENNERTKLWSKEHYILGSGRSSTDKTIAWKRSLAAKGLI